MATKTDLMGLGVPHNEAYFTGITPVLTSAVGATLASATLIGPNDFLNLVMSGTSGVRLTPPGSGDSLLGGPGMWIVNLTAASIKVYCANNAKGSAVTFFQKGTSVAGTTGMSIEAGGSVILMAATVSTIVGNAGASV
jgi:hypothetical protein